jgi:hypothetical protein
MLRCIYEPDGATVHNEYQGWCGMVLFTTNIRCPPLSVLASGRRWRICWHGRNAVSCCFIQGLMHLPQRQQQKQEQQLQSITE